MELDDAYANGAYIEGSEGFPPRWQAKAEAFRAVNPGQLDLKYGESKREILDLFLPEGTPKGLFVFVHGGYWMAFDKSFWSHLAGGMLAQGWAVALPSYDLRPQAGIAQITRQIAKAVAFAAGRVEGPIVLAGHSAGGHLAARMLDTDLLPAAVGARIKRVMPISPLSDLRPLLRTSMNETLQLDESEAAAESPVLMENRFPAEVTAWAGAEERPAFIDQARWLADAWGCEAVIAPGKHHFDVIDPLADPESEMVARLSN